MLYRLEIENFYSIRKPQVLDLRVGQSVPEAPGRFDVLFPGSKERSPRVVGIFGPNASGKSTVLKALSFIGWFTHSSFQLTPDASLPCERFNDAEAQTQPMRLAIEFSAPLDLLVAKIDDATEHGTWRYELEVIRKENRYVVGSESLKQRGGGKGKWARVFERAGDSVQASKVFGLSGYSKVIDKVRDNASLIATLAQFDHPISLRLREAAQAIVGNILVADRNEITDVSAIQYYATNSSAVEALNREIQRIDLGIRRMDVIPQATGPMAFFDHEGLQSPMPWSFESHGTRSFVKNFPWLHIGLQRGGLVLVDEIDVSIHPLVLPEIIRWFYDPNKNPHGAQLWVTCHSASLLEELLKEEVFFCEKDAQGRTSVYGMQDIQNVRRTDNRYRKYLSGAYGAVPNIG
ncbi:MULTISPECIES: AAA family ATPase [unclassified Bradyrhizobium]|uniref:AAA family ATPase n=1 Tax=unclassified Bradyrhizobium TaxID=2631580 RepID=UPI00211E33DF|nr:MULTISPECIES: ATP-binding protein [unclassified Bradyrhizobium]MDD1532686.1 abortive infection protein [Bradyrhizobium sp. WBOS8]MDD1581598.1 abortive infection protein [Bradyrhizobium sp. WBOS4]UUO49870.1 abortive infection protein [Bradyrhizobium sp. WBOS04]UUO58637.1 abortive infection protein [Bradyrhizobium sp. WBOS08]